MNESVQNKSEPKQNRHKVRNMLITIGSILLIALLIFFYWLFFARLYVSTNDAYVHGNIVEVYPQINGTITSINVNETQYVQEGDVLLQLDPTDAKVAFENSKSSLANTIRLVVKKFDTVFQLKAAVQEQQSGLMQAQIHYRNRQALVQIGGVSKEDYQNAEMNLLSAQAAYNESLERLKGAEAQIYNTTVASHPLVLEAEDQVRNAWLNLQRTTILSPVSGYVANRSAEVGESASTSAPLLSVVPLSDLWVNANFKEVKLGKLKIGQSVTLTSSMYGAKVKYEGEIIGISPGTGSVFSVLPPQNATGNWIKIVQRLPIRIGLNPKQLDEYPLRVGLTMNAKVALKSGKKQQASPPKQTYTEPLYQTHVFSGQLYGVEEIINQILSENINLNCPN